MFLSLCISSTLLLIIRSLSAAVLLATSFSNFFLYLLLDHGLYFLQKILRGDFTYWVPIEGTVGVLLSFLFRHSVKLIVDFTCIVHFRSAAELGGMFWLANLFISLVLAYACVFLYYSQDQEDDKYFMPRASALVGLSALTVAWLVNFAVFIKVMKKEYRGTFLSTQTGASFSRDYFLRGKNDEVRAGIFRRHQSHWKSIRPAVKRWVQACWWKWEDDKPDWFNDWFVASVPDDMIPKEKLAALEKEGRSRRSRRGSLVGASFGRKRSSNVDMALLLGNSMGGKVAEEREEMKKITEEMKEMRLKKAQSEQDLLDMEDLLG